MTGSNSLTFSYDSNGNTTSMGTRTFTYNQNNRLIKASENGSVLGEYTYNAFGQRIIKDIDSKKTIYHYDQLGNIISEETIGCETVRDYIYIGHSRVAMVVSKRCFADIDNDHDVDGSDLAALASDLNQGDCSTASPCPGDVNGDGVVDSDDLSILASELGKTDCPHDEYYYFHNDHLGTPQRITDQSGTIVWSANYKPFGEASITTATITNPFRFPGQYLDPETDLHYNYFRYYEPVIGRYLTPDPSHSVQSIEPNIHYLRCYLFSSSQLWHLYLYAMSNPAKMIDPFGLFSCNGTWRKVGWDRVFNVTCICYWLCVPCDNPVIWGGNPRNLPWTWGIMVHTGYGEGLESGDDCFCNKPGLEKDCKPCE